MDYLSKTEPVYICGPMTHIPQFNFPAFDAATADLRGQGYPVISPAELDEGPVRAAALASPDGAPSGLPDDTTWGKILARDVEIVADEVGSIAVLKGWEKSRGGRLETFVAALCNKPIVHYPDLMPVDEFDLVRAWCSALDSLDFPVFEEVTT